MSSHLVKCVFEVGSNLSSIMENSSRTVAFGVDVVSRIIRHHGNYTCKANDSQGHVSASKTFFVRVVGKWSVRKKTAALYLTSSKRSFPREMLSC